MAACHKASEVEFLCLPTSNIERARIIPTSLSSILHARSQSGTHSEHEARPALHKLRIDMGT